jgi:hypothetical protein
MSALPITSEEIENIIQCKYSCDNIPEKLQSDDYQRIVKMFNLFLLKHCQHEIVHDTIDIDPERSEQISYCVKCNLTLYNSLLAQVDGHRIN